MNVSNFYTMPNYKITIECGQEHKPITVAGFTTTEETEALLCRHLRNLCIQSDRSFGGTQQLVLQLMKQWQQSFSMQAMQTLQVAGNLKGVLIASMCLYKQTNTGKEQLVNRISF
ncbi:MAG: hypothetical protein NTZ59_05710 [Bacteroidetes bacterium]|nr:hypothetical protein [Bacteroidota bacterium]